MFEQVSPGRFEVNAKHMLMGVWSWFLMQKPVPFRYLPDLQIKTTLLHKPIVHFSTKTVRLRTTQTAARNSGLVLTYN